MTTIIAGQFDTFSDANAAADALRESAFAPASIAVFFNNAPGAHGAFPVGAMRARLPQTPTDAAPLVLTSGSDRASTDALAALAAGPYAALLSTRPLVAVDRRGIGTSVAIDCLSGADRR